jgi:hypothetical protein
MTFADLLIVLISNSRPTEHEYAALLEHRF